MNIGTLTVTLGVNADALNVAATRMSEFAKKTNTVNQRIRTIGYLTSAVITAPMVAAGRASFNMAKEYEYSMQKIVGLTGTSQQVVDKWGASIKAMAREFGKSPQEIADALYFIASSGIASADALDVLRVSVKAAAAGLGQTADIANYLTSVLNAYRGTGVTATYATDVLVAAVREGKAEASGFAAAMGGVIPIASKLGVEIDQVAGAMAAITLTGSTAAQSGVYLKNIFNALYKEADKGQKAMTSASLALDGMNTSYADLRKILRDQGVIALVEKIRVLTSQYGETLVAQVFPEIRAMTGMMSLMGKNFAYNSSIMKEITESSGSLAEAFNKVSQTIKIRYDRAVQSVNVSLIELGQAIATTLIPIFERFAKWLDKVVDRFNSLTEEQKRFRLIIAAVIAAAGPLLLLISSLGYGFTGLVSMGGRAIKILVALAKGLGFTAISAATAEAALAGTAIAGEAAAAGTAAAGAAAGAAGISAGAAATSFIAFGAAMGVFGLAVWMVVENAIKPLVQKIKAMRDEYKATMDLVNGTDVQMELDASISAKRFDIGKLSKDSLEALKIDIQQRLALEREDLDNARLINEEKLKAEKGYQDKLEAIRQRQKDWEWTEKDLAYSPIDLKNAFYAYQEDMQRLEKERDDYIKNGMQMAEYDKIAAESIISYYEKVAVEVDAALKKITGPIEQAAEELEKLQQQSEEVNSAFFDLMIGESAITKMSKLLGGSYDDLTEKTQLYKGILERLVEIEAKAGYSIPWVTKKIDELVKKLAELEQAKISRDLQNIAGLGNILGNSFSANADAAEVLKQALIDFNINTRGTSGAFSAMGIQGKVLQNVLDGLITRWQNYTIAATVEDTERTVGFLKAQRDAFQTLDSEIAIVSAELEGYQKYMEVLYATNRQGSAEWLIMADRIKEAQFALQALQSEGKIAPLEAMVITFGRFEDKITIAATQMDLAKDRMDLLVSQGKQFTKEYYEAADAWAYFKSQLASLQDNATLSFAKDMFIAFEDSSHAIDLINARIEVLSNKMKDLAEMKPFGWEGNLKKIAEQIDQLSMQADTISTLESAFTDLFTISKDKFEDFGSWMLDWLTSLGESLSRVLAEFVAKKLVGSIVKGLASEGEDMAEILTSVALGKAKSYEALAIAVAEAAKVGYPALLVSIPSAVAAVVGALGTGAASMAAISGGVTATGFKEGGVVPAGFPNDTFPAMLTSGEIILPPDKAAQFADEIVNKKKKEKEAALKIPKMQQGGVVPAGYPNDSFHAMLSSGEAVIPLNNIEEVFKRYPAVFKIIDQRTTDSITGQPVPPYSKLHGTLDLSFVEEVVRKALARGIDPFTALAIPHQETGGTPSGSSNPYAVNYESQAQIEKLIADPIGASLDILQAKLKLADKLGYDTYAKMVQVYNGMGRLTQGAVGGGKAYGVEIPEEGILMKENPLYGKRIEDVRNNILMQNEELVSFVESLMKSYGQPTLPTALFKTPEPTPPEYIQPIPTDTTVAITSAADALQQLITSLGVLDSTALSTADATAEVAAGTGKYGNVVSASAQGIGSVVSTAIQGGDVGKAAVGSLGSILPSLLSLIPGVGPILQLLLGGLGGGIFTGIASKMAKGGLVPAGYPNDSYPALLSSGEVVLPKEYRDMPDMLAHLTKQGSIPSGTISDELQLLLSTYEINFPEEKFKSLFAPLMKRPTIPAEQALNTRKKYITKISNVNNYTNSLTKITKDQASKSSALTKQIGQISKVAASVKGVKIKDKSSDQFASLIRTIKEAKGKDKSFDYLRKVSQVSKESKGKDKSFDYLNRISKATIGYKAKDRVGKSAANVFDTTKLVDKLGRLKKVDDRSLAYLTRISRGTEMTEKLLAGADYYPQVARMAGGGQVPSGYPNDSFPAMLSSGEYVLPKNVQRNIRNIEQKPQKIHITIDGKIKGSDIGLVLRRMNQFQ